MFDDAIETTTQQFPLSETDHTSQDKMDFSGSINEVLARPYLIQDVHLAVPGTPLTFMPDLIEQANQNFVTSISLPSAILQDTNKMSKLEYYKYFTADMKIRIETNAQPYMSGKFWIFYNPYPNLYVEGTNVATASGVSLTAYPGIEYDINQMSNGEISIPFIAYERAFDMENILDYCTLYVTQLTPIRDITTETNLRLRVYGWFENIKVFGATSNSNMPTTMLKAKVEEYNRTLKARIQINTNAEQHSKPISSIASGISKIGSSLSKVPIIGDLAGTTSFVADIVGNIASIFGFSRPTTVEPVCKINNVPGHGYTYTKSVDQAVILATRPDNELGPQKDVFQTDIDEMDIEYVARNPSVTSVFTYGGSSDNTVWLEHIYCSIFPSNYRQNFSSSAIQRVAAPTCAEYIGQLFSLWRGTMCLKISLAKTPFHNGRLIISYDPSNTISDRPIDRLGKAYTTILDLSENSSVIIKIPFLSKYDYLNTTSITAALNYELLSYGRVSIGALSPLLGPASVDSAVDVVVWKWFEDLELAEPTCVNQFSYGRTQVTDAEIQINLMNRDEENIIVFNNPVRDTSLKHAMECIGEKITNLRSLLRMHRLAYTVENGSEVTPFRDILAGTNYTYRNSDYVTYLSRMYRFWRGGFSLKVYTNDSTNYMSSRLRRRYGGTTSFYNRNDGVNTPTHITSPKLTPFHEVRIPFYSQTYRRVINNEFVNLSSLDYSFPVVTFNTDATTTSSLYVAGDDSLSYGWLIGPPSIGYSSLS